MAGDFGVLPGLASTCLGAAILLHAWPYKTLRDQLRRCFGPCVRRTATFGDVGDWDVRSRSPGGRVAVDGDLSAEDWYVLEQQGGG
jgi:hypothetical protein